MEQTEADLTGQFDLFPWLPALGRCKKARQTRKRGACTVGFVQLELEFREPDEIPEEGDYPVRVMVSALEAPALNVCGVSSIFSLADNPDIFKQKAFAKREGPVMRRVICESGVLRHLTILPQETEEWAEREKARRARQRPPRPSKKAKTRSRKLMGMIGEE